MKSTSEGKGVETKMKEMVTHSVGAKLTATWKKRISISSSCNQYALRGNGFDSNSVD